RQRRAADLRRQRRQFFELTLARRIEDGIPPQGLDAVRFHVADHEVMLTRNLATSGTSAVRRRRSTCKPAVYCVDEPSDQYCDPAAPHSFSSSKSLQSLWSLGTVGSAHRPFVFSGGTCR